MSSWNESNKYNNGWDLSNRFLMDDAWLSSKSFLLLDIFPATAAYSAGRKLKTGQQYAMQIRRELDSEWINIGFDALGNTDITTIEGFCGDSDCFVALLYDPSGNGYHQAQVLAVKQPKIYDGATNSIILENGKPALLFENAQFLENLDVTLEQPFSTLAVATFYTPQSNTTKFIYDGTIASGGNTAVGRCALYYTYGTRTFSIYAGVPLSSGITDGNQNLYFCLYDTTDSISINGVDLGVGNAGKNNLRGLRIGQANINQLEWDGTIQELIIFDSNQSSNKNIIESNINDYWSIY